MLLRTSILAATALIAASLAAQAAPLIYVDDTAGNIGTVDVPTQAVTVIGNVGVVLTDIAFSPTNFETHVGG
jgi:hypothetical protein